MNTNDRSVAVTLKLVYGLIPIVAGADKFTNLLVDWKQYLPPIELPLGLTPGVFMMAVGVIEIAAGLLVLSKWTKVGALVVSAWLIGIALNLVAAGYYDIAVRDVAMAIGAWSLSRLWAPASVEVTERQPAHA